MAGAAAGESVLYVTLSETEEELRAVAESHGLSLEGVHIHEPDGGRIRTGGTRAPPGSIITS